MTRFQYSINNAVLKIENLMKRVQGNVKPPCDLKWSTKHLLERVSKLFHIIGRRVSYFFIRWRKHIEIISTWNSRLSRNRTPCALPLFYMSSSCTRCKIKLYNRCVITLLWKQATSSDKIHSFTPFGEIHNFDSENIKFMLLWSENMLNLLNVISTLCSEKLFLSRDCVTCGKKVLFFFSGQSVK